MTNNQGHDRIIVVEDDVELRMLVCRLLKREGFDCVGAASGVDLDACLTKGPPPDLIILDLMLPGEDGVSICRRIRAGSDVPILMLTAKAEDIDRIIGLETGADDYVAKPFNPRELVARLRAILRRARNGSATLQKAQRLSFLGFVIDRGSRSVVDPAGEAVALTSGEFDLLIALASRAQLVLSREQLLDWARGRRADPFDRTIDVQIGRLRRKLSAAGAGLIVTVRNQGYMFTASVETC